MLTAPWHLVSAELSLALLSWFAACLLSHSGKCAARWLSGAEVSRLLPAVADCTYCCWFWIFTFGTPKQIHINVVESSTSLLTLLLWHIALTNWLHFRSNLTTFNHFSIGCVLRRLLEYVEPAQALNQMCSWPIFLWCVLSRQFPHLDSWGTLSKSS